MGLVPGAGSVGSRSAMQGGLEASPPCTGEMERRGPQGRGGWGWGACASHLSATAEAPTPRQAPNSARSSPGGTASTSAGPPRAHRRDPDGALRAIFELAHSQAARVGGGGGGGQVGSRPLGVGGPGSIQHKGRAPRAGQQQAGPLGVGVRAPGWEAPGEVRHGVHRNACAGGRGSSREGCWARSCAATTSQAQVAMRLASGAAL